MKKSEVAEGEAVMALELLIPEQRRTLNDAEIKAEAIAAMAGMPHEFFRELDTKAIKAFCDLKPGDEVPKGLIKGGQQAVRSWLAVRVYGLLKDAGVAVESLKMTKDGRWKSN